MECQFEIETQVSYHSANIHVAIQRRRKSFSSSSPVLFPANVSRLICYFAVFLNTLIFSSWSLILWHEIPSLRSTSAAFATEKEHLTALTAAKTPSYPELP